MKAAMAPFLRDGDQPLPTSTPPELRRGLEDVVLARTRRSQELTTRLGTLGIEVFCTENVRGHARAFVVEHLAALAWFISHVLDRLVRRPVSPIRPCAVLVLRLLRFERGGDFLGHIAGTPCAVKREDSNVDPLAEVVRLQLDLEQLLADVIHHAKRARSRTECPLGPGPLAPKVFDEVHSILHPVPAGHPQSRSAVGFPQPKHTSTEMSSGRVTTRTSER